MNDSFPPGAKRTWEQAAETAEVSDTGTPEVHDPSTDKQLPQVRDMAEAQEKSEEVSHESEPAPTEVTPAEPESSSSDESSSDDSSSDASDGDSGDSSEG